MPKLTAELIIDSPQFMNAVRDWELCLRGNKIQVIENLGATLDQFDTIDFSNNEIRRLDGFPYLHRLRSVIINNNKIYRIGAGLGDYLPQLETLVLTHNNLEELKDLDPLASISTLKNLSVLRNPVIHKPQYRLYIIYRIPQLRVLDFRRIRQKEREKADAMFSGQQGEEKLQALTKQPPKTYTPGEPINNEQAPPVATPPIVSGPSPDDIRRIREAIANAKSLEEVQHLETLLKSGQIPGQIPGTGMGHGTSNGIDEEHEMDEN